MLDESKIEELVLALFGASEFGNGRVWKQFDFNITNSLFEKGLIFNPCNKSKSIQMTHEGLTRAKELAHKYLSQSPQE